MIHRHFRRRHTETETPGEEKEVGVRQESTGRTLENDKKEGME